MKAVLKKAVSYKNNFLDRRIHHPARLHQAHAIILPNITNSIDQSEKTNNRDRKKYKELTAEQIDN